MKVVLGTHLRDKHGHLFLWDLELVWPSFKVGQTKFLKMHFCQLSRNWVLKANLGTRWRDMHGHLFLWDLELFWPSFKVCQTKVENMHFCWLYHNWVLKSVEVPIWDISIDTYFYEICNYFGPSSRLVKPRLKIYTLVDFLQIELLK